MSTQSALSQGLSPQENVFAGSRLGHLLRPWIIETVMEWLRRMGSRRELATMSEAELRDIGFPARAAAEKTKPFWRT
jgi:uncharacterized protein YjiS (DUF1127 family)